MLTYHTAIIGAGASGLFCAGSFNMPKIILDHNKLPGVKVSVSGGGKCNFTNLSVKPTDYVCTRKHFCKNALAAFTPTDFTALLNKQHLAYEERTKGQLFAQHAQDIVRFLCKRAKVANTDFALNTQVLSITKTRDGFMLHTSAGTLHAQNVVLATGGLSFPALGASSFGIQVARQFDIPLITQRPALCGMIFPKELQNRFKSLAGNSTLATVQTGKYTFTDQLLFTHEGVSGPAILSASLYWEEGAPVSINFLPDANVREILMSHKQSNQKPSILFDLPGKMAQTLLDSLNQPLANMTKKTIEEIVTQLQAFSFVPTRTTGYTKAEVTAGGIDTQAINPSTFEVKNIPGLYIIGELLDVTGRLGGFNLHWAWASGYQAGKNLAKKF